MHIDVSLLVPDLSTAPQLARAAEAVGFDALWTSETKHNPFLPLVLAAEHTDRLKLGTAVAIAFPRSPLVTAHVAWDLQKFSRGRFILGLGTQVKAHIERRFGVPWEAPVAKLREYILALRAIWDAWQNRTPLNFRGRFYKHTLMTDFFDPGPIDHPHIPIYIAGVNPGLIRLAGELADGFHVHPFHSVRYMQEVFLPTLEEALRTAGRSRQDVQLASTVFAITGRNRQEMDAVREMVRQQIAFYASTPSYRLVLEVHGWGEVGERLSRLAARKRWHEMPALISDEMLHTYAVEAPWSELGAALVDRYRGILDRVALYYPFRVEDAAMWQELIQTVRELTRDAANTGA